MTDPTEEAAMLLDRSALDAGTEVVVDGGTITDSDDQWGPWVPIVLATVPSVSTIQMHQLSPRFHRCPPIQMHQLSQLRHQLGISLVFQESCELLTPVG